MSNQGIPFINTTAFPFQDRILIFADPAEEVTQGGIIIPDTAKEKPKRGTVVLIGNDVTEPIRIGQRVVYGKFSGQEFAFGGVKYDAIRPNDGIIAIPQGKTEEEMIEWRPVVDFKSQKATMTT